MKLNPQTQDPMQSSGSSSSFAAEQERAILKRMPLVLPAQASVTGPVSWEQTLDRAAKGKNPKPAQMFQRTSTSKKGGVWYSLPGCIHHPLPSLSNLKRFLKVKNKP